MKTVLSRLVLSSVAFGLSGAISAQPAAPPAPAKMDAPEALAHIAAARTAAGTQWKEAADYFCAADPRVNDPSDPQLPPTKVFDNLYYIGAAGTGSWIVQTGEGLVMIDTGYPQHLETVLLPGMAALKLNPADVKYILIGHGIWDHWGGAAHFQDKYGTRVLMGTASGWKPTENWKETYARITATQRTGASGGPRIVAGRVAAEPPANTVAPQFDPKRDIKWMGQDVLTVGDTRFTIKEAPGGISIVFPVKDGSVTHTAGLFGATILIPGWQGVERLKEYVRTLAQWSELTRQMNVDVEIQNHPLYDGITEKAAAIRAGKKGAEHPFVVGKEGYQRFVTVMSECMQAHIAQREAAPK